MSCCDSLFDIFLHVQYTRIEFVGVSDVNLSILTDGVTNYSDVTREERVAHTCRVWRNLEGEKGKEEKKGKQGWERESEGEKGKRRKRKRLK